MMAIRYHRLRIMVTTEIYIEVTIPINGAKKINKTVLIIVSASTIFAQEKLSPFIERACAMAAPANPPINV